MENKIIKFRLIIIDPGDPSCRLLNNLVINSCDKRFHHTMSGADDASKVVGPMDRVEIDAYVQDRLNHRKLLSTYRQAVMR